MTDASILVVGAGVAGRALSVALARRGLECSIVERRPRETGLGMGLNLPGNAVRALAALGVADQVVPLGVPVRRREFRNGRGRLLFAVDDEGFWRGVGSPVCVFHGHLLRALEAASTVDAVHGTRVLHARPVGDAVEVRLDGEDGPRRYDLVVGADGVHSGVRAAVDDEAVRPSAMTGSTWRFVAANPGVGCWTAWSGDRGTFLLIPVADGLVYGYASSTRGRAAGADPRWLATTFSAFPHPVAHVVEAVLSGEGELLHAPVDEVRLTRWHRGRLLLIGDAAHATGPVWAQGAAMALEDALVLSDLLTRHRDWSDVGAELERLRRPRVKHVQTASDRMSRLARLPGRLRDHAAPVLGPRAYRAAYGPLRADPLCGNPPSGAPGSGRRPG